MKFILSLHDTDATDCAFKLERDGQSRIYLVESDSWNMLGAIWDLIDGGCVDPLDFDDFPNLKPLLELLWQHGDVGDWEQA